MHFLVLWKPCKTITALLGFETFLKNQTADIQISSGTVYFQQFSMQAKLSFTLDVAAPLPAGMCSADITALTLLYVTV